MGVVSPHTTGTANDTIKVLSYLSSGYVLQIVGTPPSQGTHTLTALTTPSTSQPGTEQFGMNLAANTTPAIGANPVQVPSSAFAFGYATTNYDQADLFTYNNNDIIAKSNSSSGETDYTLSIIMNVSSVTPGGQYSGTYSAVAVPTF